MKKFLYISVLLFICSGQFFAADVSDYKIPASSADLCNRFSEDFFDKLTAKERLAIVGGIGASALITTLYLIHEIGVNVGHKDIRDAVSTLYNDGKDFVKFGYVEWIKPTAQAPVKLCAFLIKACLKKEEKESNSKENKTIVEKNN